MNKFLLGVLSTAVMSIAVYFLLSKMMKEKN